MKYLMYTVAKVGRNATRLTEFSQTVSGFPKLLMFTWTLSSFVPRKSKTT